MVAHKVVNAEDNEQVPAELVGQTSLAEVIERRGAIRGSFYLNGHEFRDFEARSPGQVVEQINQATGRTGLTAELDDEFHLVLMSDSAQEIRVASGLGADRDRERQKWADDDQRARKNGKAPATDRKSAFEDDQEADVLNQLGLEASDDVSASRGAGWQPGRSAEDRKKAREAEQANRPGGLRNAVQGQTPGDRELRRQGADGGGISTLNSGPSDTTSRDPHAPETGRPVEGVEHGKPVGTEGAGLSPPDGPRPGTTEATKEQPSL